MQEQCLGHQVISFKMSDKRAITTKAFEPDRDVFGVKTAFMISN